MILFYSLKKQGRKRSIENVGGNAHRYGGGEPEVMDFFCHSQSSMDTECLMSLSTSRGDGETTLVFLKPGCILELCRHLEKITAGSTRSISEKLNDWIEVGRGGSPGIGIAHECQHLPVWSSPTKQCLPVLKPCVSVIQWHM